MKRVKKILAILMLLCLMPITVQAQESKLSIVTSFYPMYAMTKAVVGDLYDVYMVNSGNGIHQFEPSANDIAAIYDADIFIYHSVALESWTKNLEKNKGNAKVILVESARDLEMDKVSGLETVESVKGQEQASLYDPHTWLDPVKAGEEVQLIAAQLSEIDPDHASDFKVNADAFQKETTALVEKYKSVFDSMKKKTFVTQHTAFYYLANRFGLTQLGIAGISSDAEPGARKIGEVQEFVKQYDVKTIFVEPNVSDRIAQVIAKATGVSIVSLSPLESDPQNTLSFIENLDNVLKTLSDALAAEQ
ncbi:zinc ABC transporter substrate-binding protein [Aerococcaceae bacterium zg-ZJ1578]|uniref:metal ABC transporter solute-binding protein, Zn/Mn family n=1 Tax=Aerococcaceae TaxID=186827 RepID=UPI0013BC7E59|nr:zinc ABC transporter substrate-binding protein [Aerococcaceae bacterium zg-1578]MBR7926866.1 zinc ABC transporter substrate-binding protein [Aerococcaceae bacterium zg-ZUI334]MBS4460987.1 zinc ABC transporter substrate-binding protein [Aerococcaceae bacterium zg-B36]NEW64820.1 adhesion protein [Facklamia sp. 252]NEW68142.1 adhesion protein [Facklamia sp. 253]QQD64973.1 zinc ABC transporter substrate-binding protein [Aerococcaceae bacterium zg-252]